MLMHNNLNRSHFALENLSGFFFRLDVSLTVLSLILFLSFIITHTHTHTHTRYQVTPSVRDFKSDQEPVVKWGLPAFQ